MNENEEEKIVGEDITELSSNKNASIKKYKNKILITIAILAVLVTGAIYTINETKDGKGDKDVWTEEQLYEEISIDYSILDKSVIESEVDLLSWYKENVEVKGVYAKTKGEFTYVLVSGGKQNDTGYAIQLFDVREGEKDVYVGYNILTPEDVQLENDINTPNMLVRIDKSDKKVVGKMIKEKVEKIDEPNTTNDELLIEEQDSTK